MADILEVVEFRDLQITLYQGDTGFWIRVERFDSIGFITENPYINAWSSDGKPPSLVPGLCRRLWDIYGKQMTKDSKSGE